MRCFCLFFPYRGLGARACAAQEKVGDVDSASNKPNLIAGLECLLPATSYDIALSSA